MHPVLSMLNPVNCMEEILVVISFVLVVLLTCKYWKNLMLFFTGDERFHISSLRQCYWFALTCCGRCNGEWTRFVTKYLCCCYPRWRGMNIYQAFGQYFGLTTRSVEIKNIVCGDLPYQGYVADFYVGVECSSNPIMYTSVVEMVEPKLIHFPDVITLRLRNNASEHPVRIVVRAMHVVGSEDIAACYVEASTIFNWASQENEKERIKRIELTPCDTRKNPLTNGWVLLQFDSTPIDKRNLDHFNGNVSTVRTMATYGADSRTEASRELARTEPYEERSIKDFKHEYTLVNPAGGVAVELDEDELSALRQQEWCYCIFWWFLTLAVSLVVVSACYLRIYEWTCWHQMVDLATAYLQHHDFPINLEDLNEIDLQCAKELNGIRGVVEPGSRPCMPSEQQVVDFCKPRYLGGSEWPEDANGTELQPRPHMLQRDIQQRFGIIIPTIECSVETCYAHARVRQLDLWAAAGVISLLVLWLCCTFKVREQLDEEKTRIRGLKETGGAMSPLRVLTGSVSLSELSQWRDEVRARRGEGGTGLV